MPKLKPVLAIESRYNAPTEQEIGQNRILARNVCRIAVMRGYRPRASHLFYTQFLDDGYPTERALGIECGLQDVSEAKQAWMVLRDGEELSRGMLIALNRHIEEGRSIRYFRTSDNGFTLRQVTSFLKEVEDGGKAQEQSQG